MITQLPDKQKAELDELVKDPIANLIIMKMMSVVLLGFLALTKDQMRLFIKFLIESVDELDEVDKDPAKYLKEIINEL